MIGKESSRSYTNRLRRMAGGLPHAATVTAKAIPASQKFALTTVQDRISKLSAFHKHYEEIVEILCDAAQYGPDDKMRGAYGELRRWFRDSYEPMRPFLGAFLPPDQNFAFRLSSGRALDAFEELLDAQSVEEFLRSDDGEMIRRINETRQALYLYDRHLRLLAACSE